jgi:hypothetical protein
METVQMASSRETPQDSRDLAEREGLDLSWFQLEPSELFSAVSA